MSTTTEILNGVKNQANAFKISTIDESAFIEGKSFTHADYTLGIAESAIINYIFDPRACTCDNVVAENPIFNSTSGPITIEYYVGATVSALGTELVTFNRRPNIVDFCIQFRNNSFLKLTYSGHSNRK